MNYFFKYFIPILLFSLAQFGASATDVYGRNIIHNHPVVQLQLVLETESDTSTIDVSYECPIRNFDTFVHRRHTATSSTLTGFAQEISSVFSAADFEKANLISSRGFGNKCQSCCYDFLFRFCLF
ncbi:MAG: hypothetical protein IT256_04880 [Chitinophagaceae bacterium]|nr:hypothetical protein [Chitinophagaceae bacterium]